MPGTFPCTFEHTPVKQTQSEARNPSQKVSLETERSFRRAQISELNLLANNADVQTVTSHFLKAPFKQQRSSALFFHVQHLMHFFFFFKPTQKEAQLTQRSLFGMWQLKKTEYWETQCLLENYQNQSWLCMFVHTRKLTVVSSGCLWTFTRCQ